jgi:uncharacterized protein YbjT (DUF2867 family)
MRVLVCGATGCVSQALVSRVLQVSAIDTAAV